VIKAIINDYDMAQLGIGCVPMEVELRMELNKQGIKFKDDGKVSAIINKSPEPLGVLRINRDYKAMSTVYEQQL